MSNVIYDMMKTEVLCTTGTTTLENWHISKTENDSQPKHSTPNKYIPRKNGNLCFPFKKIWVCIAGLLLITENCK